MTTAKQMLNAKRKSGRESAARKATAQKAQGFVRRNYWLTPSQHDELAKVADALREAV